MKKSTKDRPTWASFRHIPNNEEGDEFMRLFKKYRNKDILGSYFKKGRKPIKGASYSYGGYCKIKEASEFSLYIRKNINYKGEYFRILQEKNKLECELNESQDSRLDWRYCYYEYRNKSILNIIIMRFKAWIKKEQS